VKILLCFLFGAAAAASAAENGRALSLTEARELALKNHARITAADLNVQAAQEGIQQNRAAYLPNISLNAARVDTSLSGLRAASPGLPVSGIYDRGSASVSLTQLITDFGRTSSLTASSRLRAEAEKQNAQATRAQVLLEVDAAYFSILQSQALLNVAEQAVKTRTLLRDNTVAFRNNQLRSALDVSFAEVNLKDAELLLSRTRNDLQAAHAGLARLVMEGGPTRYQVSAPPQPPMLPGSVEALIAEALRSRPELEKLRREREAARKLAGAERASNLPTFSLQGTAGTMPYRDPALNANYAAAGIVMNFPVFTGGLNSARQREANLRAQVAEQVLRDEEARVTRDVQVAWYNASNAQERLAITDQLRAQAAQAFSLAEARYKVGSSSVIELSQAQLNLTSAEINQTTTRYEYLLRRSMLDYQLGALVPRSTKPE
jgi:outer membrane protein